MIHSERMSRVDHAWLRMDNDANLIALTDRFTPTALKDRARPERKEQTVKLKGTTSGLEGIPIGALTRDRSRRSHGR